MNVASFVLLLSSLISPQNGTPASLPKGDQRLDAPVTYETRARLTSAILDDLSKSTKVSLSVDEQLEGEPLIVRLHDVPLRDAMDEIAHALYGSWKQEDQSYLLSRPPEVQEQLEQARIDERVKKISALITEALKSQPTKPITYGDVKLYLQSSSYVDGKPLAVVTDAEGEEMGKNLPDSRLAAAVFSLLDPRAIAEAKYLENIVFSDQPSPLEQKINVTTEELNKIYEEQNTWTNFEHQYWLTDAPQGLVGNRGKAHHSSRRRPPSRKSVLR